MSPRQRLLFSFFCAVFVAVKCQSTETLGLYIVYSNSSRYNSSEALAAIENAVISSSINETIPGYKLEIVQKLDSKCSHSLTIQAAIEYLSNPNRSPFVAIVGGGCSPSTNALVDVATAQNVPLVSYTPSYTRQSTNFYQMYPSDNSMINSLVAVVDYYEWTQVAIITEMEDKFLEIERLLTMALQARNINVSDSLQVWPHRNIMNITKSFFDNTETRIFVLNTFEDTARRILCTAYYKNIFYPGYAWLLYGWYNQDWLSFGNDVNCTQDQLDRSVDRAIVIQQHDTNNDGSYISQFATDAITALAIALNDTQNMINDMTAVDVESCNGPFTPLDNITANTQCLLRYNLLKTMFNGNSGYVAFNEDRTRTVNNVSLLQYREGVSMPVLFATVDVMSSRPNLQFVGNVSNFTVWPDGVPPDGTPIIAYSTYPLVLVIIMYTWASAGIIFTFACLIFNIVFRKRKIVRLTSPNLNYFIVTGALIAFAIPFVVLNQTFDRTVLLFSCISNVWQVSLGTSLVFAPMLAKMLRIYRIFKNPRASKKVLTDWHLFFIVVLLVSVSVVILFLGTVIPFTRPVVSFSEDRETLPERNEMDILVIFMGVNCYTTGSLIWILIVELYVILLEAIAVVLAVLTRQVKVEAVNDSKEVVAVVYIVTACSVVSVVIPLTLQDYSNVSEGFFLTAILLATSSAVLLNFVPKMWSLYNDPNGENVFEQQSMRSGSVLQSQLHRQDSERIETLQREVGTLKERLNSIRLTSVREIPEVSEDDNSNEKPNTNGLKYRDRLPSDVFSPPITPSDDNEKRIDAKQ